MSSAIIRRQLSTQVSTVDVMGSALFYSKYLSKFQVEKFEYMFHSLFDLDKNDLIEKADILALAEKMRLYAGWDQDDEAYQSLLDVQHIFLECLQDQVKAEFAACHGDDTEIMSWEEARKPIQVETTSITLNQWLNMWGKLCYGSAGLADFSCWVQLLPPIFFKIIDADKDGVLSIDEYKRFYKDFVGIPESELDKVTNEGYRAMTAGGDYDLTEENFGFCFANFLLGRGIYGPGKYIFGVFDNRDMDEPFQVQYNHEDEEEDNE